MMADRLIDRQHPALGILILNHNGSKWLPPLYRSIQSNGYPNVRVYLVDNASADDSVEATLLDHPNVTILRMPHNLGYCMAYNLAIPQALADGCEWLILSNNDVLLDPGCLTRLVRVCRDHRGIGVAGPAFLAWDRDEPNPYMLGNHPQAIPAMQANSEIPLDVEWVEGSFLMLSRSCIEKVGPLDPYLFAYWEEADFCRRARRHGERVVLVPSARARHYGGGSWDGSELRNLRRWLLVRNQYIYKLANPEQSFSRNIAAACHLLCVYARQATASSIFRELGFFGKVLSELPAIHRKWQNDRAGVTPASTTGEYRSAKVERLRGAERLGCVATGM
jgi:GT2 family glycosyltransferase